mgnify:CR=1 FL=1
MDDFRLKILSYKDKRVEIGLMTRIDIAIECLPPVSRRTDASEPSYSRKHGIIGYFFQKSVKKVTKKCSSWRKSCCSKEKVKNMVPRRRHIFQKNWKNVIITDLNLTKIILTFFLVHQRSPNS